MAEHDYLSPFEAKTYDETMALLLQAKHYENYSKPDEVIEYNPFDRMSVVRESIRVTSRLSHVMAWLLYRKAVSAGEMEEAESLRAQDQLDQEKTTTDTSFHKSPEIPRGLRALLEQSMSLYMRVARIDRKLRDNEGRFFGNRIVAS